MSPRSLATGLGLLLGGGALVLQFWLSMSARLGQGHDLLNALLWFFTYFTILTNLMLVLIYLSALSSARWLGWWRSPVTRGMMAAAMTLVMGFYHFVLAATWQPQGLFHLADVLLHYATPLVYLGWWLAFQAKGRLRLSDIGWMLLPPLGWLAWTMARGAVGCVTDGLVRDVRKIREAAFPVFHGGIGPLDSKGRGEVVRIDVPVRVGGVLVHPGDILFGDADGCVVIPQAIEADVVKAAREKLRGETKTKEALMAGRKLGDVFAEFGVL